MAVITETRKTKIIKLKNTILLVLVCSAYGCSNTACTESSEAVSYARGLSQKRLTQLYHDMEKFSNKDNLPIGGYSRHRKDREIPEEFQDLKVAKIRPSDGNIMVEGCFDHYVYLNFYGFGKMKKRHPKKEIVLSWGEYTNAGSEVI